MAEAAGLAISGIALVSLFSTCLEILDYFEQGKNWSKDVHISLTKVTLMKHRLREWGSAMAIDSLDTDACKLHDRWPKESGVIFESMLGIRDILGRATEMCRRHARYAGDVPSMSESGWEGEELRTVIKCHGSTQPTFKATFLTCNPSSRPSSSSRRRVLASLHLKLVWVFSDKCKLECLIADFDFLLSNLEKVSQHLRQDFTMASRNPGTEFDHVDEGYYGETSRPTSRAARRPSRSDAIVIKQSSNDVLPPGDIEVQQITGDGNTRLVQVPAAAIADLKAQPGQSQHLAVGNAAHDDALVFVGDYYESSGTQPSRGQGQGHNYVGNKGHDNGSFLMGNSDGKTVKSLFETKWQLRQGHHKRQ